jgi:hypothetical protein
MKNLTILFSFLLLFSIVQTTKAISGDGTNANPYLMDNLDEISASSMNVIFIPTVSGYINVKTEDQGCFIGLGIYYNTDDYPTMINSAQIFREYYQQTYYVTAGVKYHISFSQNSSIHIKLSIDVTREIILVTVGRNSDYEYTSIIDETNKSIAVSIPNEYDLTKSTLSVYKTGSEFTNAIINDKIVVNGFKYDYPNNVDLTKIKNITITDTNKISTVYSIRFDKYNAANLESYSINGQISSKIDTATRTVYVVMPNGTQLTNLISNFSISAGAKALTNIEQVSGVTVNDFTYGQSYEIRSKDNSTNKFYYIVVTNEVPKSDETNITAFNIAGQVSSQIDEVSKSILITMPFGTSVKNLVSTFTLSTGASVKVGTTTQTSGTTVNNFTNPLYYNVTAENGTTTQKWTVKVIVNKNSEAKLTSFSILGQASSYLDETNKMVTVVMPSGTDVTNLIADFTTSYSKAVVEVNNIIQISGNTENDFTNKVYYKVTAEDGINYENWIIIVSVKTSINTGVETNLNDNVNVYPNPSTGLFNINLSNLSGDVKLNIYSTTGVNIWSKTVNGDIQSLSADLTGNKSGMYFLKIENENSSSTIKLIIK